MISSLASEVIPDFPILSRKVRGENRLTYLDSAATSQKPNQVIDAVSDYYRTTNATIHRSGHELGELASAAYESGRDNIAQFVKVKPGNLVFTKNATEGLNLVAYAYLNATLLSKQNKQYQKYALSSNDEIWVTEMEHHANLVPWQHLAHVTGAQLKFISVTSDGYLDFDPNMFSERTKIVSITHQSNVLGTINDVVAISNAANQVGAAFILDACQSVPHLETDLASLDVAAAAFSGHKMLGPTGVGVLYLRDDLLHGLPPFLMGGNMIETVNFDKSTFRDDNGRFEAGTMNIAQVVGLSAAVSYLDRIGIDRVHRHEAELTELALQGLLEIEGIRILGPLESTKRGGLVSFEVDGVHPHDVSQYLDAHGIAVRAGHHCAWPLHRKLRAIASTRASFYLYNNVEDIGHFLSTMTNIRKYFKVA